MLAQLGQIDVEGESASVARTRATITALMGADVAIAERLRELGKSEPHRIPPTHLDHAPANDVMHNDRERRILQYVVVPFIRNELDPPYE